MHSERVTCAIGGALWLLVGCGSANDPTSLASSTTEALGPGNANGGPAQPVVNTDRGPVRGVSTSNGAEFLGIPYAAPPVGDLRWRAPQPAASWQTPRDASQFANHCPQLASPFGVASTTEDCLYLNVYTQQAAPRGGPLLRPVMVYIHGGAFLTGESDDYGPRRFLGSNVVLVTINYRLGALGFMANAALAAESPDGSSGNYGLMDQQAALGWVSRNINAFGGDPNNVTIFGESAGGLSVHANLVSPRSKGLFAHAIVESGAYALTQPTLAAAESAGAAYATSLGCGATDLVCLRSQSVSISSRSKARARRRTCRSWTARSCPSQSGRRSRAVSSTRSPSSKDRTMTSFACS
jgi:para-nitrobenzyl esterase